LIAVFSGNQSAFSSLVIVVMERALEIELEEGQACIETEARDEQPSPESTYYPVSATTPIPFVADIIRESLPRGGCTCDR
jgi:hypothetical protein